ncbi:MAG: DUF4011 domain-containing protein [Desulfocapsaceae bacterium]|nr:DUF4011 domain-containing protein [Desulfocapsaceae bacterium]
MSDNEENKYQANDADTVVGEIFSGGITVSEAIERLRKRLLDLSSRNRLLNYRHPKGRSVQIADEPNSNLVFERIYDDGKAVPFKYVPEPDPKSYEGKRPEAKLQAARIGISTSFEFSPSQTETQGRRLHGIQTLLYPADLERQLRKIASEARTAIEETGSNMLYLVFGFLEFYDSEDSDRPLLAPLISLPVTLVREGIAPDTRTYQYSVMHSGEDLAENHTLREKVRRDFMLSLPEFAEEDSPEAYFARIEQAVRNKHRWKVRRQITLGMLSFGKLAIWSDLDTKKNPGLLEHDLIKSVFSGGQCEVGDGFHAEDYRIDEFPLESQALIYDADSSQHSAIIDVLSGKNMVINGPPGTGKSQTITNIIASALSKGKKVLFVSEKLAALDVVRNRLNHAGLGHFCLELHSHKTHKKKFLEDVEVRIEQQFPSSVKLQAKQATLQRQKVELARYAELIGSRIGNALGMTINEIFWAAERRRQELGDLSGVVNAIGFPDASRWVYDDIESRRSRIEGLAELHDAVGQFNEQHPWWGFYPNPLIPSDDDAIARIIRHALERAREADRAAEDAVLYFNLNDQPSTVSAGLIREKLANILEFPGEADASLLGKMFAPNSDPNGQHSFKCLSDIVSGVEKARELFKVASTSLIDGTQFSGDEVEEIKNRVVYRQLQDSLMSADLYKAQERAVVFEQAVEAFAAAAQDTTPPYNAASQAAVEEFLGAYAKISALGLAPVRITRALDRAKALTDVISKLVTALDHISDIAKRRKLAFDSSPDSVARLAGSHGIPGLANQVEINPQILEKARRFVAFPLADKSIAEIERLKGSLETETAICVDALGRCRTIIERFGIAFDQTERSVEEASILATLALQAPADLLEYRQPSFGHVRTTELIAKIESFLVSEQKMRADLDQIFYLDALPEISDIKSSVVVLRQKDGFFAFFDGKWRKARQLHAGLCKEKRKLSARQRMEELACLISWIESRDAFIEDPEFKECFGSLFRGLETDIEKIVRLNDWYLSTHAAFVKCPGLSDKVNLSSIPSERISELAVKANIVCVDVESLVGIDAAIRGVLGANITGFRDARARSWDEGLECLHRAVTGLETESGFFAEFADRNLSPRDALRLMEAKAELEASSSDLALLMEGHKALKEVAGDELSQIVAVTDGQWSERLPMLSKMASLVADTVHQALAFAGVDSSFLFAETFARTKSTMDEKWADITSLPAWNRFENWQGLIVAAQDEGRAVREFLEKLATCARPSVSAAAVLGAIAKKIEAESILDRLARSEEVSLLFGNLFQRADTDLERLSLTHAWGRSVCEIDLPAAVQWRLLSDGAQEVLGRGRALFSEIDDSCRDTKVFLEGLCSYGSFNWDEWQKQERAQNLLDRPAEIVRRIESADVAPGSVLPWSKYLMAREQAQQLGLGDFVDALESNKIPSSSLASAFELSAYQSIGRSIYQAFPELSGFTGATHDKIRADYQALDAEIVSLTGKDFASQIDTRTRVPEGRRGATVGEYTDMHLLRREISKQRRHIPIRQLIKRAGNALQELKPCFMMGPLSVAQYLEQGVLEFDLVVMDEASQLRPEEALGAIARGNQLVVVGDPKQLPPTSFFDRLVDSGDGDEEDDEAPAAISGMESILDICQQLFTPVRSLRWHYRSQHESLIAFSNHHFYKNLVVFPSPYAKNPGLGVKYRYVKNGLYRDRQNKPEAQRVVDAVLEHMIKRPDESLGVVTLNQTQRELIEDLLDKKLKTFTEGVEFLGRWETEGWPFFVKNLENVQGDERDVIFISTTFGKVPGTDKVRQNFGPISRPDGWRRLNVLFTRSKRRIELFTSMSPEDIIVDEKTPLGTKALRDYLDFAKFGVLVTTDENVREPDSDFEISVANVITAIGYEVKPQLGVAGFFIDMAVRNPDRPGEFLAGIECDGATYHSGNSVRDRDRIRQEILESLGWKSRIHRIWSTDWFYNPRKEVERLRNFLEERRRISIAEEPDNWEKADNYTLDDDSSETVEAIEEQPIEDVTTSVGGDDAFVEVGDRVTYDFVDDSKNRHYVFIVDSESNPKMGIINELTPVAQALLGLSSGDVGDLKVPGQKTRQLRVLKIQRQEELLA